MISRSARRSPSPANPAAMIASSAATPVYSSGDRLAVSEEDPSPEGSSGGSCPGVPVVWEVGGSAVFVASGDSVPGLGAVGDCLLLCRILRQSRLPESCPGGTVVESLSQVSFRALQERV